MLIMPVFELLLFKDFPKQQGCFLIRIQNFSVDEENRSQKGGCSNVYTKRRKGTVETVTDILSGVGTAAGAIGAVAGFVSSMSFMS